jgi:hypothetical protein
MFINEQIHRNAQATTVLLASLCRGEYYKVSGLDNAKQIWDTLRISHEGNDVTLLTKMELVEGELGRFAIIRGEEPTQTYNRLKTLINKIRSYGSTRWTDHDVVRLMHGRDMSRRYFVHRPRRNVVNVPRKVNEPSTIYHALNASFAICRKDRKIVARKLGAKYKGDKTCIWVPKTIVTNLVGPNKSWVPKTQA